MCILSQPNTRIRVCLVLGEAFITSSCSSSIVSSCKATASRWGNKDLLSWWLLPQKTKVSVCVYACPLSGRHYKTMCVTLAGISCFYCWYCVCVSSILGVSQTKGAWCRHQSHLSDHAFFVSPYDFLSSIPDCARSDWCLQVSPDWLGDTKAKRDTHANTHSEAQTFRGNHAISVLTTSWKQSRRISEELPVRAVSVCKCVFYK